MRSPAIEIWDGLWRTPGRKKSKSWLKRGMLQKQHAWSTIESDTRAYSRNVVLAMNERYISLQDDKTKKRRTLISVMQPWLDSGTTSSDSSNVFTAMSRLNQTPLLCKSAKSENPGKLPTHGYWWTYKWRRVTRFLATSNMATGERHIRKWEEK